MWLDNQYIQASSDTVIILKHLQSASKSHMLYAHRKRHVTSPKEIISYNKPRQRSDKTLYDRSVQKESRGADRK